MFGGVDPRKMQGLMKQMGIKQEEIETERVIIEKSDGNRIVIEPANVIKMTMQGQTSWQITGDAREEVVEEVGIKEADILMIMEKTGKSKEEAAKALEESNGDIAEAIVSLSE